MMPAREARALLLLCLKNPSSPPNNRIAKSPQIARMLGLYSMTKNLGALPDAGGLLDQRSDVYAYFGIFSSAEAEHMESLNR